jgi:outer membrane protein assembly factor BamA
MKVAKISAFIFLILPFFLKAQLALLPSVGAQIPTGDFSSKNYFGSDFGANLALKYEITETFDMGLSIGYHRFSYDAESQTNAMFPVLILFEKRFGEYQFKPLIGMDLGIYTLYHTEIVKKEISSLSMSRSTTNPGCAPTMGFCYEFSRNFGLHAVAKYNVMYQKESPATYVSMNIGLNIRFTKERSKYIRF